MIPTVVAILSVFLAAAGGLVLGLQIRKPSTVEVPILRADWIDLENAVGRYEDLVLAESMLNREDLDQDVRILALSDLCRANVETSERLAKVGAHLTDRAETEASLRALEALILGDVDEVRMAYSYLQAYERGRLLADLDRSMAGLLRRELGAIDQKVLGSKGIG